MFLLLHTLKKNTYVRRHTETLIFVFYKYINFESLSYMVNKLNISQQERIFQ